MCSLGLWRHSISIGYSASIKSSMKGRQSGDTPDPLSPHQPPGTPPTPLRTPLHPSPLAPLPSAASSRPGCQVMKFDLFIGTLGGLYCVNCGPLPSLNCFASAASFQVTKCLLRNNSPSSAPPEWPQWRRGSRCIGKSIPSPRHSSCNFNCGGTVRSRGKSPCCCDIMLRLHGRKSSPESTARRL